MKKFYLIAIITGMLTSSCGKSKEEIELEKAKIELEKTKLELAEKEKSEELRVHEQKMNVGKSKKLAILESMLKDISEAIKTTKINIEKTKEFQIGRSASTKEKQLFEVQKQLNELYNIERNVKNEVAQLEYFKTFDFQKTPQSIMEYIFDSAKKNDFSNFRYLVDPYGENDNDSNSICFIETMPLQAKNKFKTDLETGRIMGETSFDSDRAKIEFAHGTGSNTLSTMKFIKRNELMVYIRNINLNSFIVISYYLKTF